MLFDPDAPLGFSGFGLNPTGVFVWKLLDGEHTLDDLAREIQSRTADAPEDVQGHIRIFAEALLSEGLASFGGRGAHQESLSRSSTEEDKAHVSGTPLG